MIKLIVLFLVLAGCAAQVDAEPTSTPAEDCLAGGLKSRFMITPPSVTTIDAKLATENEVTGCVEIENPGPPSEQHYWCCWKTDGVEL